MFFYMDQLEDGLFLFFFFQLYIPLELILAVSKNVPFIRLRD